MSYRRNRYRKRRYNKARYGKAFYKQGRGMVRYKYVNGRRVGTVKARGRY